MCEHCGCATTPGRVHIHHGDPVHDRNHVHPGDHVHLKGAGYEEGGAARPTARPSASISPAHDPATLGVVRHLLAANEREAAHNRAHFDAHGVLAVNLMSAPGSGKTSLLEATLDALGGRYRIAVIEGDLETENDAARIRAKGVPAVQITTGEACHLDAAMVHEALHGLVLDGLDILFIENVGNLVCPASFDLGQHADVVLLATTEGDDKPAKYPVMFRTADLVLITKADLLPVLDDFSPARAEAHLRRLANAAPLFTVSARRPASLAPWIFWLEARLAEIRRVPAAASPRHDAHPSPAAD
jgi:hydrogenase nickel incorporation protein HypB